VDKERRTERKDDGRNLHLAAAAIDAIEPTTHDDARRTFTNDTREGLWIKIPTHSV